MQFFTGLADAFDQPGLDIHMNILKRDRPLEVTLLDVRLNTLQTGNNGTALLCGNDAGVGEHAGMRDRAGDVVAIQPLVEVNRGSKRLHEGIGRFREASAPGFC
jgi:hypothetical protein